MTRRRTFGAIRPSQRAEVGIGTMIVFIATVLVGAIAAGVILDMSTKLQERSSKTGEAATQLVATTLVVESAVGRRNATGDGELQWLELFVGLGPGAASLDLSQVKINWMTATESGWLNYTNEAWGEANEFVATAVSDPDGSFTGASPAVTYGDLIRIHISSRDADNGMDLDPRSPATLMFDSETGLSMEFGFTTPVSYASNLNIELR